MFLPRLASIGLVKITERPRVILRHVESYDPARIRVVTREALRALGLRPRGRTLVKPNCVASGEQFQHAYTRPEFLEGVLQALLDEKDESLSELVVGERCGITIPTRMAFRDAGYYPMLERVGVNHVHFEEVPQVEIQYTHAGRLRDMVYVPETVANADFFVNCPKFKSHPWTTVTFSMKNYIGIQDDRHRLIDHDHRLDQKIADLQYVLQPELIAIDAIIAGEGRMLTPKPRLMQLVMFGNCQTAIDAVGCAILGVDPHTVGHLELAHQRGFGPLDLEHISIEGDVTLEEAQRRASGFEVGLVRVEKFFEGTNVTAYAGPPPESESKEGYCWGGCPGAIEESVEILRQFDAECDAKMPKLHFVFGAYEGPIDAKPGEPVIFIGDCASYHGDVAGKRISIESLYKDRSSRDPHHVKHDDIYMKMLSVSREVSRAKSTGEPIRLQGCPVSVSEQVLAICAVSKVKNPITDPKSAVQFNTAYFAWRAKMLERRLMGKPYQVAGPHVRGASAPVISEPR